MESFINRTISDLFHFIAKRFRWCAIIVFAFTVMISGSAMAQEVIVKAKLDKNNILIGDHVKLELQVKFPKKYTVQFPIINDTISAHIDVVERMKVDTGFADSTKNIMLLKQTVIITSYDSGYWAIPSFEFTFRLGADTSINTVLTEAELLTVKSIKVDTTKSIMDIKPPLSVPLTWKEIMPWVIGSVVLVAIIALLIYFFIQRKKKKPLFKMLTKPEEPAHVIALKKLEKLRETKLWQQNLVKLYYIELTEILREYIEKRFNVSALEMTTDELMLALKNVEIKSEIKNKLRQILALADMVKFAKAQPLPNEHDECMTFSFEIVKDTMQFAEKAEKTEMPDNKMK